MMDLTYKLAEGCRLLIANTDQQDKLGDTKVVLAQVDGAGEKVGKSIKLPELRKKWLFLRVRCADSGVTWDRAVEVPKHPISITVTFVHPIQVFIVSGDTSRDVPHTKE